jgi:hypothetical protein
MYADFIIHSQCLGLQSAGYYIVLVILVVDGYVVVAKIGPSFYAKMALLTEPLGKPYQNCSFATIKSEIS